MNKANIDREKIKYIIAFALIAVVVLLLCITPTRDFLIGIFGYAIFAYVVAVFIATLLLALGKRIVISKKRVMIYVTLFFSIVITLHVVTTKQAFLDENSQFVNTQFGEYLWGPFAEYETAGGVVMSMLTFYVVPMGYVASLIIFFIAAATLGLVAMWPLLVYREKPVEKRKFIEDVERAPITITQDSSSGQQTAVEERLSEPMRATVTVSNEQLKEQEPIIISTRPTASEILFQNAEQPKDDKKDLVPSALRHNLTEMEMTYVMGDRDVVDTTLPQELQIDADRALGEYVTRVVYTGGEDPSEYQQPEVAEDDVKTDYDIYIESVPEEDRIIEMHEVADDDESEEVDEIEEVDEPIATEDSTDDWDMGEDSDELADNPIEEPQEIVEETIPESAPKPRIVTVSEPQEEQTPVVTQPSTAEGSQPVQAPATPKPTPKPQQEAPQEKPEERYTPYVYKAPPLSMLAEPTGISGEVEDFMQVKECLDELMINFKIDAQVVSAVKGPTVTRYELNIGPTVNVNRFDKIKDNIAMRLMVESVLILAPIPGKNAVGIEVPNKKRRMVGLREIIGSQKFVLSKGLLDFALGTTVDNEPYFFDLAKAPHMLIAGATGSGKSCGINSLLISLLYKYSPDDLKFILIDPKRVELLSYCGLPHMLIPNTICEIDKAVNAVKWLCGEMDRRYTVLSAARTVNIKEYNEMCIAQGKKKMPNIVLVIDEMADLMLRARNSIEENICRIAAVGRACGIHLVIATQRPDATVITGLIKSNIPTCIAFAVKSALESNIILGQGEGGAKSLIGNGDALFKTSSMKDLLRFQGAFVSGAEVRQITDYIRANNKSEFDQEVEEKMLASQEKPESLAASDDDLGDKDSEKSDNYERLCIKVLKSFIIQNRASVSMVQSQHGKGYIKACKIVNTLTEWGCISEQEPGGKARRVLITMEEFKERFGDIDNAGTDDDD